MPLEAIILVVEDSGDDLRLLQRFFAKAGLRQPLRSVPDGVEAMSYLLGRGGYADRARYPQPNLLLIDISMPRVNGLELMSWLRTQPDFQHLIVVALSSSSDQEEINRAYQMGAHSYLLKPGSGTDMEKIVKTFCDYWIGSNCFPEIAAPSGGGPDLRGIDPLQDPQERGVSSPLQH